jgi:Uma2 family endonuclease
MPVKTRATIEDLYHVPENGKAELVNGELKLMPPAGDSHGSATLEIAVSLRAHARRTGVEGAYRDNVGFIVDLPNRKSFSPDAAYYIGPRSGGKFLQGAPVFAVECVVKATMVQRRNGKSPPSAATISPPAAWWCGMWTY